jgi:hypothetical protein
LIQIKQKQEEKRVYMEDIKMGVGDRITFKGGNEYKLRKTKISGDLSVTYYTLEEPYKELRVTRTKDVRFRTLRELNYELNKQKELIEEIIPIEFKKEKVELTIGECHIKALEINRIKKEIKALGIRWY